MQKIVVMKGARLFTGLWLKEIEMLAAICLKWSCRAMMTMLLALGSAKQIRPCDELFIDKSQKLNQFTTSRRKLNPCFVVKLAPLSRDSNRPKHERKKPQVKCHEKRTFQRSSQRTFSAAYPRRSICHTFQLKTAPFSTRHSEIVVKRNEKLNEWTNFSNSLVRDWLRVI